MDYEAMSIRELQEECRRRGLPSGRVKAELVERLTGHDADEGPSLADGDYALSSTAVREAAAEANLELPEAPAPRAFRLEFPAELGGPDEEVHLACRQATVQAAIEAGLIPRGDARLAQVQGDVWVYEVSVRAGDRS